MKSWNGKYANVPSAPLSHVFMDVRRDSDHIFLAPSDFVGSDGRWQWSAEANLDHTFQIGVRRYRHGTFRPARDVSCNHRLAALFPVDFSPPCVMRPIRDQPALQPMKNNLATRALYHTRLLVFTLICRFSRQSTLCPLSERPFADIRSVDTHWFLMATSGG